MIADFSITPIGVGESLSKYVGQVFKIIQDSDLAFQHHAMGTNIEGDWDDVINLITRCRNKLLEHSSRVSISIKIDDRIDHPDRIFRKVESAEEKIPA